MTSSKYNAAKKKKEKKRDIPKTVERYVKEHLDQGYDESKAWAIAWSRFCKFKYPDSDRCQQDEYLPNQGVKSASWEDTLIKIGTLVPELRDDIRNVLAKESPYRFERRLRDKGLEAKDYFGELRTLMHKNTWKIEDMEKFLILFQLTKDRYPRMLMQMKTYAPLQKVEAKVLHLMEKDVIALKEDLIDRVIQRYESLTGVLPQGAWELVSEAYNLPYVIKPLFGDEFLEFSYEERKTISALLQENVQRFVDAPNKRDFLLREYGSDLKSILDPKIRSYYLENFFSKGFS